MSQQKRCQSLGCRQVVLSEPFCILHQWKCLTCETRVNKKNSFCWICAAKTKPKYSIAHNLYLAQIEKTIEEDAIRHTKLD